jgi:hypothetical protein
MRVICIECGALGRINKTNRLSENVAHLYCQCTDAECGHRWVSTLAYNRTLTPSKRCVGDAMVAILELASEQRTALANALNQQLAAEREEKNKPAYQRR